MLFYYLKETINSLLRSKLGTLLIITTTAIAIIFSTLSIGLIVFSNAINKKLKENISINLFVADSVSNKNYKFIEKELDENIYVESFRLISKDQALRDMKRKTGQDFLSVLESNPLPASYLVRLVPDSVSSASVDPIVKSLGKTYGIDDLVYDYTLTLKILNFINSSKQIIYGVSIFLVFLAIYLVYSNNKLLLSSHTDRYNTMKLVGAKLRTIKIPIFLNGIIVGLFSAVICLGLFFAAFKFLHRFYRYNLIDISFEYFIGFIVFLGIILGFLGSYLATLNVSLKINKKL